MDSIEQPFDSINSINTTSSDKAELIDDGYDKQRNGDSPGASNSLLHGQQNQGLRVIIISAIVFAVAVTVALILTIYLEPKQAYGHAAVACDDVRCSEIGLQILKDGGNAVDAAVAAAFCQGVVSPAYSGLGGGGFGIVHDHKFMKSNGYDFRETAPSQVTHSMVASADKDSIVNTGVPGQLKGLAAMHQNHGSLHWRDVVAPSIELAKEFMVSGNLLETAFSRVNAAKLRGTPLGNVLLTADGKLKTREDNITIPGLVNTLRHIQRDSDTLYTGLLRKSFVEQVQTLGGKITEDDMKNYSVSEPSVILSKFKDLNVVNLPPPAGSVVVAMILNIIESLNWEAKWYGDSFMYHGLIEAFKFGFAHKSLLGDPDFKSDMIKTAKTLLDKDFAKTLAEKIETANETHSDPSYYGPSLPPIENAGTTHISVIDSSELMVSLTLSINQPFGNKKLLPSGILLNNQLLDFDLRNSDKNVNFLKANKRPQSSMSPMILFNADHPCEHRIVVGGSNGLKIITGVAETIVNSVVFKKDITQAIQVPRVHNQLSDTTFYESGIPDAVIKELEKMGHKMKLSNEPLSAVQGIEKTNDDLGVFSDIRKQGQAAEY